MIKCVLFCHDEADRRFLQLWVRQVPRAGEMLWFGDEDLNVIRNIYAGATSLRVTEVAHWVTAAYAPHTHTGDPIHTVALFVKPQGAHWGHE